MLSSPKLRHAGPAGAINNMLLICWICATTRNQRHRAKLSCGCRAGLRLCVLGELIAIVEVRYHSGTMTNVRRLRATSPRANHVASTHMRGNQHISPGISKPALMRAFHVLAEPSRPLGVVAVGLVWLGFAGSTAPAIATSPTNIHETARLHLVSHRGTKILQEEGYASGTLHGRITATIKIGYAEAIVTFTAQSSNGTLSGRGVESYYVYGKDGHFRGHMAVTGGTGHYAHVSGSTLQTTGLIKRPHYDAQMTVVGMLKS